MNIVEAHFWYILITFIAGVVFGWSTYHFFQRLKSKYSKAQNITSPNSQSQL